MLEQEELSRVGGCGQVVEGWARGCSLKTGKAGLFPVVEGWIQVRLFVVDGGWQTEGFIM